MLAMNGIERSRVFSLPEHSMRDSGTAVLEIPAAEMVVEKWKGMSCKLHAHSQIMRIRAEDSHLGEDIGEGNLRPKEKLGVASHFMVFSRPMLPASPLSGKTAH